MKNPFDSLLGTVLCGLALTAVLYSLVRSLVARGGYDHEDFCRRLDEDLFPLLDGLPMNGPGGYTSQSIREVWRRRVGAGPS